MKLVATREQLMQRYSTAQEAIKAGWKWNSKKQLFER